MEEIFRLVGKIVVDNDGANKAIDDTTSHAESGGGSMVNSFKKIGAAVMTYLAVDKIIAFGKSCVESAAQVKAQTAQFEAAFGDMQGQAKSMFGGISEETGVLATRLQTVGTGAFSQFKGAGLDAADALKKTGEYTNLAADAAAYYDMSLEEADSLMRSFIRGNTEAGDRIGLFTSETQRNDAALAKLGKKYVECTEAEKQMIMLDIASNIYKSSGAMGQASREADGYENVVGNLKEAWRQFMAIIGQPILEAVIPVLQKMTSTILDAGDTVKKFGSSFKTYFEDNIEKIKPIWERYGKPIFDSFKSILMTLYETGVKIFPSIKQLFQTLMSTIKVAWNTIGKPVWDTLIWVIKQVASLFKSLMPQVSQVVSSVFKTISNVFNTVLKPVFTLIGTLLRTVILPVFKTVFSTALSVVKAAFKGIQVVWNSVLKPVINTISKVIGTLAKTFNTVFNKVYNAVKTPMTKAFNFIKDIINKIKGFFNFKISWPKIPLPHFAISPKGWKVGDLLKGVKPKLSIDWYKKAMDNPMIMNRPSIFGYNPATGQLMGGGEAGSEVVSGTATLLDLIRQAVYSVNGNMAEILESILAVLQYYLPTLSQLQVCLETGVLVGEIAPAMDEELGKIKAWKEK